MSARKNPAPLIVSRLEAGPPLSLSASDLEALIDSFTSAYLAGKSPETIGTYRRSLNEFERWFQASQGKFQFRQEDVLRYKTYLAEDRGLHEVSISTYLTAIRRFCQYLLELGLLRQNPAQGVKGSRRPVGHTRAVLQSDEVERVLSVIDSESAIGKRDMAIVHMMLYAGLAEIEIVRADVGDLEQTLMGWYLRVQGKGRNTKDQQVPVDTNVMNQIRIYLDSRGRIRPENPLFVSHGHRSDGERLNTRSVRSRVNQYLKEAGIKRDGISPHSLTHTAPLLWMQEGKSLEEVRERMRHGSIETTSIYLKRLEE